MLQLERQLADHIILMLNKSKFKFMSLNQVQEYLKEEMKENYTSEVSIAVKNILKEDESLDFFREDTYNHEMRYYYCTGNWIAPRALYKTPVEAKLKMGWYAWQEDKEIDWDKD